MRYRKLGSRSSCVVDWFRGIPLGDVFGTVSSKTAARAVSAAIEAGINLSDVSPHYGSTLAEERLGEALAGKRQSILLSTKCGRYGADIFDFSAERITREFEGSLRRLRTDSVDVLLAHDIEFADVRQIVQETIPAM